MSPQVVSFPVHLRQESEEKEEKKISHSPKENIRAWERGINHLMLVLIWMNNLIKHVPYQRLSDKSLYDMVKLFAYKL